MVDKGVEETFRGGASIGVIHLDVLSCGWDMVMAVVGASLEVLELLIHKRFRVCEDAVQGGEELTTVDPGGLIAGDVVLQV